MNNYQKLLTNTKTLYSYEHLCPVCAQNLLIENHYLICDELAQDWKLSDYEQRKFNFREGSLCQHCKSSVRLRNLAKVFLDIVNLHYEFNLQNMEDLVKNNHLINLNIAEINHCGTIHEYLAQLPNLYYSEYDSANKFVRHEDLMNLTYSDKYFDLVLMSDVLEHVPNIEIALQEIFRVMKDNGHFIFTIPFLYDRMTHVRAKISTNGEIIYLDTPSYHGDYSTKMIDHLVFYEFGKDFIELLEKYFTVCIYNFDDYGEETTITFYCTKRGKNKC